MSDRLPAITLWQPWATLVAERLKPYEFRSWPAPRRLWGQRVAIHAGARPVRRAELAELICKLEHEDWRQTRLNDPGRALGLLECWFNGPRSLPLSSVLCIATLGKPIQNQELAAAMGVACANDSDRNEHSNWGWPLTDIERLEPFIPARGAQGWWTWTWTKEAANG